MAEESSQSLPAGFKLEVQPVRITGLKLIEIKTSTFGDTQIPAEMVGSLDPALFKGLKIYDRFTGEIIGYVERAWKAEEGESSWWLAVLRLFADFSLGIRYAETNLTSLGIPIDEKTLTPTEVRLWLPQPKTTGWEVAKQLAQITDLGVDEAHDVVKSWLKKYGRRK